jgi:hypothetical protein
MATEPAIAILSATVDAPAGRAARRHGAMADYWALTKPEVTFLILVTTFAGSIWRRPSNPAGYRQGLARSRKTREQTVSRHKFCPRNVSGKLVFCAV